MSEAFLLVIDAAGDLLTWNQDGPGAARIAGDDAMWRATGDQLCHAVTGATLRWTEEGRLRGPEGDLGGTFVSQRGPARLPSDHLEELRDQGVTVLENVITGDELQQLKDDSARVRDRDYPEDSGFDGRLWLREGILWSVELARAVTNPVALGLMRAYMQNDDIRFCHQPIVTTMKPARDVLGTFPPGGWHADYPYHPGVFPEDHWPEAPVFGVQYNICMDEFREDNAATQFVPDSFRLRRNPDAEFNRGGTRAGEGVHRAVSQMLAPAGAALIYDSRMWHRACDELNVSGEQRWAVLNAVAPAYVPPMMPMDGEWSAYQATEMSTALTDRERSDLEAMCAGVTAALPAGVPLMVDGSTERDARRRKMGR